MGGSFSHARGSISFHRLPLHAVSPGQEVEGRTWGQALLGGVEMLPLGHSPGGQHYHVLSSPIRSLT